MPLITNPEELLERVRSAAGDGLTHADALAIVVRAALPAHASELHDAAFKAKFLSRTWTVMRRLGANDPARAQLKDVFQQETEELRLILAELVVDAAPDDRDRFRNRYLAMDGPAFARFLEFLADLAWVQNVRIDSR